MILSEIRVFRGFKRGLIRTLIFQKLEKLFDLIPGNWTVCSENFPVMFWLALTREDDEEVEIFGTADSVHSEAGG